MGTDEGTRTAEVGSHKSDASSDRGLRSMPENDHNDTPTIVVRSPKSGMDSDEESRRPPVKSPSMEAVMMKKAPSPALGEKDKKNRRISVDCNDLLSPEDLGVAFAMRVASKEQPRKPAYKRLRTALTRVLPDDDDDSHVPKKKSEVLGRKRSDISARIETVKKGVKKLMTLRRPEKLLMCSGAISGFYVMAGLAVEPACVPSEAGNVFQRLGSRQHGVSAMCSLVHLVMSVAYTATALGGRMLKALWPDNAPKETIVGDLTIPKDEVQVSRWWSPSLFLELLALVGTVAEFVHVQEAETGLPTVAQWIMLLQVFKCWRILHKDTVAGDDQGGLVWGLARVLCSLAVFAHVMMTVLMAIGVHEAFWGESSWLHSLQGGYDHPDGCFVLYIEGWYFAVLSLTSVGYGDLLVTPLERGVNSFFLLFSQLYTAKVCADLTWITSTHNHWEAQHQAQRAQAWVALQHMQVPRVLAERVMAFQTYLATVHREDLMQPAFEGLSKNLMMELRLCTYRKLVLRAPFLREQHRDVMTFIVGALSDMVFLPGDVIVRSGDKGRELFFMRRGKAQVYVGGEPPVWGISDPVAQYVVGNYFGELGMLTGHPRKAWIMAEVYSVVSVLQYSAVEELMNQYPGAFTSLVQAMVGQYDLKSSMTWEQVTERLEAKYGFSNAQEAFLWFLSHGRSNEDEELGAKAFEEALLRLKVPSLDRKILWAEMDQDNSGFVTLEEFSEKLDMALSVEAAPVRSNVRNWSKGSSNNAVSRQPTQDMAAYNALQHWRAPTLGHCPSRSEVAQQLKPGENHSTDVLNEVREVRKELSESREQSRRLVQEVITLKQAITKPPEMPAGMQNPSSSLQLPIQQSSLPGAIATPSGTGTQTSLVRNLTAEFNRLPPLNLGEHAGA